MPDPALRLILGALLIATALAKLRSPSASRDALGETFGVTVPAMRPVIWATVVAAELALGIGVAAGVGGAAYLAAALMAVFAAVMVGAILRGKAGEPCGCFGAESRIGWPAVFRNLGLAAAFAALPALSDVELATDTWLGIGLGVALVACAGLAVAVLALAREIGSLRMRVGPDSALELPDEGPELGSRTSLIAEFGEREQAGFALAVFTSPACRICAGLEPAIATLAAHPALSLRSFGEDTDPDAWAALDVPGSPYAVAMSTEGEVLAKGTFNNLAQLESVIATAERRRGAQAGVGGIG
ncbi:hypothetical protein BH10ACT11_BH10ACT11_01550 [soil metagenome]